jgi:hypothetical protein
VAELKTDNKTDRAQRIERQHRVDLLLVGLFCAVVALGVLQLVR